MTRIIDPALLLEFARAAQPFTEGLEDGCLQFDINSNARLAAFLAQTAHESAGYTKTHEVFDYAPDQLLLEFGRHMTASQAKALGRQPGEDYVPRERQVQIADIVYAGRMGNGDDASGDGSVFRGRGLIQITGRDEYALCGTALGLNLTGNPELLQEPQHAAMSAAWYWQTHGCNELADAGDFEGITRAINGGLNGLASREVWWDKAKALWVPA